MTRYAVVGASSGTGREIVRYLAERHLPVRAISRHPLPAQQGVEAFAADVTDASINNALQGGFDAVFYTVDIHGVGNSREAVRTVMYDGCVNTIRAALAGQVKRFVLLSVIGPERPTWVWWVLDGMKRGIRRNIIDRERSLRESGLAYVICRAPKLTNKPGNLVLLAATAPQHRLGMRMGLSRSDLAQVLIRAAKAAPDCTTWDVFPDAAGPAPPWLAG